MYDIRIGIVAAVGTRLAIQSMPVQCFEFHPFQLHDMGALYCHCLSEHPGVWREWGVVSGAARLFCTFGRVDSPT